MRKTLVGLIAVLGLVLMLGLVGCQNSSEPERGEEETGEHDGGSESAGEQTGKGEESNEHEGGSESGEEGEESGTQFALGDTFDEVRAGARLVLSYDGNSNAFTGTVENTTEAALDRVRVEVHLSNGIELGPTTPIDLAPGQSVEVTLAASDEPFTSWSAHPEVN